MDLQFRIIRSKIVKVNLLKKGFPRVRLNTYGRIGFSLRSNVRVLGEWIVYM
jgi:hypothetical protein